MFEGFSLSLSPLTFLLYLFIPSQAERRRSDDDEPFIFPYDLGGWKNFKQVPENGRMAE